MLSPGRLSSYGFQYEAWGGAPTSQPGINVTPGASNAEGSWTQIAAGSDLSRDCYWIVLSIWAGSQSATNNGTLLDIGIDPAGGTSYTAIVSNMVVGAQPAGLTNPRPYFLLPLFIKAGSSVAVRLQYSSATPPTCKVIGKFYGDPSNPTMMPVGQFSETIGTITNSSGPTVTPGNGTWGSYANLGTTTRDLWWWQLCVQNSSAAVTVLQTWFELSYGDASNKTPFMKKQVSGNTSEIVFHDIDCNQLFPECYQAVPGGSNIYCRAWCSSSPNASWNAVAVGVGS